MEFFAIVMPMKNEGVEKKIVTKAGAVELAVSTKKQKAKPQIVSALRENLKRRKAAASHKGKAAS